MRNGPGWFPKGPATAAYPGSRRPSPGDDGWRWGNTSDGRRPERSYEQALPGRTTLCYTDAMGTGTHSDVPRRPSVAIVLAAGRSERLREVTGGGSKAL